MSYEVGQNLWFVGKHRYICSGVVRITEISRKWMKLSNGYRLEVKSVLPAAVFGTASYTKDYGSVGTAYASKEQHDAIVELQREWNFLRDNLSRKWTAPEGVTAEKIREAMLLLGVENAETA